MDYQLSSFSINVTLLLSVLLVLRIWKTWKISHSTSVPKLAPGPWKLPLIGNMHHLLGSLPHHCLSKLAKKYGPLMHLQLGEVSHIVVSSPEIAHEVLKTYDMNFAHRPKLLGASVLFYNYSDIGFAPYGNQWRQLRKICTLELLSAKRVKSFQPIREEEVSNLIRSISSNVRSPINLTELAFSLANDITARATFGKRCEEKEAFLLVVTKLLEVLGGFSLVDFFPSVKFLEFLSGMRSKLERLHREEDKIIEKIISEHKESRRKGRPNTDEEENLLDVLLNLQEDEDLDFRLTTNNVKAIIMDMFTAGSETSARVIEWAMSEMLKNPRVLKKAQAEVRRVFEKQKNVVEAGLHELQYMNLVIKETLRLHPPAPLILPRECRESCEINGYYIPVGTKVIVNAWAIGRDANYWNEAEIFYPERFLESLVDYKGNCFAFIPFGAGRRICPGIQFGTAAVELALAQLLYHFNWELPDGEKNEDLDMTEAFAVTVGRKNDLYLIPIPYDPDFSE